jgi:ABC-type molybdate transport system substrate-binding protein
MSGDNEYTFGTLQFEQSEEEIVQEEKRRQFRTRCLVIWTSIVIACIVLIVIVLSVLYSENFNRGASKTMTPSRVLDGNVTVYYAASLQDVMTRLINPEFTSISNVGVIGVPGPSGALASALKTGITADVFISADSAISASLLPILLPSSKSTILSWYTLWADTQLGIGYNINSKFNQTFEAIANGSLPWYEGLDQTMMKIGRTDPDLDPKGDNDDYFMFFIDSYLCF